MFAKNLANKAFMAARDALAQGDYEMARAALRWARRADSGNPLYIHAEAILAQRTGGHHEADRLFRRALDIAERALGAGHIHNVAISSRMIALYEEMGLTDEAELLRHRIINHLDRKSAADGSVLALDRLAEICLQAGRSADALAIYQAALDRRRAAFGENHARVNECHVALTRLRARIRKLADTQSMRADRFIIRPEIVWRSEDKTKPRLSA